MVVATGCFGCVAHASGCWAAPWACALHIYHRKRGATPADAVGTWMMFVRSNAYLPGEGATCSGCLVCVCISPVLPAPTQLPTRHRTRADTTNTQTHAITATRCVRYYSFSAPAADCGGIFRFTDTYVDRPAYLAGIGCGVHYDHMQRGWVITSASRRILSWRTVPPTTSPDLDSGQAPQRYSGATEVYCTTPPPTPLPTRAPTSTPTRAPTLTPSPAPTLTPTWTPSHSPTPHPAPEPLLP